MGKGAERCPTDAEVADLIAGAASTEARRRAASHAATCDPCRELLACVGRVRAHAPESARERSDRLADRFVLEAPVGSGGQGAVWLAHDEQLQRRVAIKFAHREPGATLAAAASAQAEARALGRFAHPNVVQVFALGACAPHDPRPDGFPAEHLAYFVMEHVPGNTLVAWVRERSPSTREILRLAAQAGAGLQAAHDAGLVHRDIKPANLLVGNDGRVRVADFGLADAAFEPATRSSGPTLDNHGADPHRDTDATSGDPPSGAAPEHGGASADAGSNEHAVAASNQAASGTARVVGTPSYMAPEQLRGGAVSPAADQYALAATLFEMLYGARPHVAASYPELLDLKEAGPPTQPRPARVSDRTYAALAKALAPSPADRHSSVREFIGKLTRRPRVRSYAALAGVVGVSVFASVALSVSSGQGPRCDAAGRLDGVWDRAGKQALRNAFNRSERRFAQRTAAAVEARVDVFAERWVGGRDQACRDARADAQPSAARDLQIACYDGALAELAAVLDVLEGGDDDRLAGATAAVAALPSPAACDDAEQRAQRGPGGLGEAERARAEAIDAELTRVRALHRAGDFATALAEVDGPLKRAQAIGYVAALVRAQLQRGQAARRTGRYVVAREALEVAHRLGVEHGMPREASFAASELAFVVGMDLGDVTAGAQWLRHATALAEGSGDADAQRRALSAAGHLALFRGEQDRGLELHEQALQRAREDAGVEHPDYARGLINLASAAMRCGDIERSIALARDALAAFERIFGPEHPEFAAALSNLGLALAASGELDEARRLQERALDVVEAALGPEHVKNAIVLASLGSVARGGAQWAVARSYFERAIALRERGGVAEHPDTAAIYSSLASVAAAQGAQVEAATLHRRALAILVETVGPTHPLAATSHYALGKAAYQRGALDRAQERLREAVRIREEIYGREHASLAWSLTYLGRALVRAGALDEAERVHQRVLRLREREGEPGRRRHEDTAINDLGRVAAARGDHEAARTFFARSLELGRAGSASPRQLAYAQTGLGRALTALGRPDEAIPLLEQAARVRATEVRDPMLAPETWFALAQTGSPSDGASKALAQRALSAYDTLGDRARPEAAAVRSWLRGAVEQG